jgi:hypothetical protein
MTTLPTFFLDIECDSLDPALAQILQIGIVDQDGQVIFGRSYGLSFGAYQDESESQQALDYIKYSRYYCENLPLFCADDARLIVRCIDEVPTWAHNSAFDQSILVAQCQKLGVDPPSNDLNCTMDLACKTFGKFGQTRMRLPQLSMDSTPHGAVADAQNCRLLWHKCNKTGPFDPALTPDLNF